MKQLIILLLVAIASCTNQQSAERQENNKAHDHQNSAETVPLNNGGKWKADEATKKNVAVMVQVVNDTTYAGAENKEQLYTSMQTKVDTLVDQCRMKGPEHEALHVWLEKVLKDMKELKEEGNEYSEAYATLKEHVES